jgi:GNAT superfamily N-acetyltransferase
MGDEAESITTYLEMREPVVPQATPPHRNGVLLRVAEPSPSFYRFLMDHVAAPPPDLDDAALAGRMVDPDYDVYVLYLGGVPAALFELDRREPSEIELVGFGVLDGFAGRGLGKYLLAHAIDTAWQHGPERVWVRSTNRDDPRRILLLQWAGFVPYEATRERRS